ncbi:MAG: helix-turn-helix domain-containing protein [Microbacterium sp.]
MISMHIVRHGALALGSSAEDWRMGHGGSAVNDFSALTRLGEGASFISDGATRHQVIVVGDCELVSLSVPAEVFPADLRSVLSSSSSSSSSPSSPVAVGLPTPLSVGIGEFLANAVETEFADLSGAQRHLFERILKEMAMSLVADSAGAWAEKRQEKTFPAALAVIVARCADSSLSAAAVAADVNVSVRQLGRVFAAHGTTVSREIRQARIDRAVRMLSTAEFDGVSVDQIAKRSGFGRGSSLARAMDAVGAGTPGEVRAARW